MHANPAMMFEYDARAGESSDDALFLERLDTFMEKSLGDIKAFAEREFRPYEETRRCIAQWHAKYLFQPSADPEITSRVAQVRSTLCNTSRILESLSEVAGVQSFFLAIDPNDPNDGGFLGGSLIGREFWRDMRGGGDTGVRAFRAFYTNQAQTVANAGKVVDRPVSTPPAPKAKTSEGPARYLKNELYETVRNALRTTSGIRNAEMKWTNPEKLDIYGVHLVGWPEGVPAQNPSMLKAGQNKLLHKAILSGSMRFERLSGLQAGNTGEGSTRGECSDSNDDFSWAYDVDARSPSPLPKEPPPTRPSVQRSLTAASSISPDGQLEPPNTWEMDPITGGETTLASYNVDYSWDDGFTEGMMDGLGAEWDSIGQSHLERPRKRARSEDPGS